MLINIERGQSVSGSAGLNRPVVRLSVGDVVTVGDRRIALAPDILVVWHKDDAGTWHGVRDPEELKTLKALEARRFQVGADLPGVELTSSSRGRDVAALVLKVTRPVAVVTSGYDGRRGWRVRVFQPALDGVELAFDGAPSEWRARHAPVEAL